MSRTGTDHDESMTTSEKRRITCEESNALLDAEGARYQGWSVGSSLTDISGEYGEPKIVTVWVRDGVCVENIRHPNPEGGQDAKPCEHYTYPYIDPFQEDDE